MSQCYAPNAVPVSQLGPCNPAESVSLCCTPGQICLTNGLCATGERQFYSGACTDKTYKDPICPSFCMGPNKFVVECHDSVIPDGGFCCDATGTGTCCGSLSNKLELAPSVSSAMAANPSAISSPKGERSSSISSSGRPTSSASAASAPSSKSEHSPSISSIESTISLETTSVETSLVDDGTSTHLVLSTVTSTLVPVPTTTASAKRSSGLTISGRNVLLAVAVPMAIIIMAFGTYKFVGHYLKFSPTRQTRESRARAAVIGDSAANKSEPNVHELHNVPAPTPELPPPSAPRENAIHELGTDGPALNPPSYRHPLQRRETSWPGRSHPDSPVSAVIAPSPRRQVSGIAHMDGSRTPPRMQLVQGRELPVLTNSPPPPYQASDGGPATSRRDEGRSTIVPNQDEGGSTPPSGIRAERHRSELMMRVRIRPWDHGVDGLDA